MANEHMHDWQGSQMEVVPLEKCAWDPYAMVGSLEKCGFKASDTSLPIPIFPVPPRSDLAARLAAADDAFKLLRAAMAENKQLLQ